MDHAVVAASDVLASAITRAFDGMHARFALVIAAQIAAYAFATYVALLPAVLGGLVALVGLWIALWSLAPSLNDFAWMAVIVAVPWISGRVVQDQRKQRQQLETMAARLERQRETSAQLAVAEERARMARELHQAIARALEQMIAKAVTAETALSASPALARRALRAVQDTGRREITEMRRMLRILRTDRWRGLHPKHHRARRRRDDAGDHGTADPMLPLEHGEALAEEIPTARLLALQGGGHGVDRADWETIVRAIVEHTAPGHPTTER